VILGRFLRQRYWILYPAWILATSVIVFALAKTDNGPRRGEGIRNTAAAVLALQTIERLDSRYAGYEVVHIARAQSRLDGSPTRWVVLCDRPRRTGLRETVVVEIRAADGRVLRVRRPVR